MKKNNIVLALVMTLLMILLVQAFKYYSLKAYYFNNNEMYYDNQQVKDSELKHKTLQLSEFISMIKAPYISINTLKNDKNNIKATLNFQGNMQELFEYITYLNENKIFIKEYIIEKNDFLQCFMEIGTS